MKRREFMKYMGLTSGVLTIVPHIFKDGESLLAQQAQVKVYKVMNGDYLQNTNKICDMINISNYINATDIIVIKGNAQWPYQGYTHTGVIKAVIDKILEIPDFTGEVLICDNVQAYGKTGEIAFDVPLDKRNHNWPNHNWTTLAEEYQANGKPVAVKRWLNDENDISTPADGEGWIRDYFNFHSVDTYFSYPIFESPLTPGRMIDMKNGVWEGGDYTGREVKAIFMPNLNNHGHGEEDRAGLTSAIKSFFGATEIHYGANSTFRGYANIHKSSLFTSGADYMGEIVARYINTMYRPVLYITAAIWSGHHSRTGDAVETKTVLACENPTTLDYVAARDVISPHASYLNPDEDNNTRKQILGCIGGGVGTIDSQQYEIIAYDFDNPSGIESILSNSLRPGGFLLEQNYPNPFNSETVIPFYMAKSVPVQILIYNQLGQLVRTLVNKSLGQGHYQVRWNGRDNQNRPTPTGVYYCNMIVGAQKYKQKLIYLR